MRFNPTVRRIYLAPALGLVLVTAMSACSSSASSSSSTPGASASAVTSTAASASASPAVTASGSSSAVSAITANWNTFFNTATSTSKREQLLQDGSDFAAALKDFAASPLASAVTSKVDSVKLTSSTEATVKYDLSALGTSVAKGASGTSVLQDGTWKVGDSVFCGLLSEAKGAGLSIPVPSVCG
jgi:hypothetical protein